MYQRILVPVDASPTSRRGLEEAIAIAKLTGGSLRLIHVIDELSFALAAGTHSSGTGELLQILREQGEELLQGETAFAQAAGVPCSRVLADSLTGTVTQLVVDEAAQWPADLIVLGTHGRRGVGRMLMGSSAEAIVRQAAAPSLLVRSATAQ